MKKTYNFTIKFSNHIPHDYFKDFTPVNTPSYKRYFGLRNLSKVPGRYLNSSLFNPLTGLFNFGARSLVKPFSNNAYNFIKHNKMYGSVSGLAGLTATSFLLPYLWNNRKNISNWFSNAYTKTSNGAKWVYNTVANSKPVKAIEESGVFDRIGRTSVNNANHIQQNAQAAANSKPVQYTVDKAQQAGVYVANSKPVQYTVDKAQQAGVYIAPKIPQVVDYINDKAPPIINAGVEAYSTYNFLPKLIRKTVTNANPNNISSTLKQDVQNSDLYRKGEEFYTTHKENIDKSVATMSTGVGMATDMYNNNKELIDTAKDVYAKGKKLQSNINKAKDMYTHVNPNQPEEIQPVSQ